MKGLVKFEFNLPADVKKKGKLFIAKCPLLDVYSQGDSKKEALEHLTEALQLFVESCFERGTLDQVMKKCGFEFRTGDKKSLRTQAHETRTDCVRVPVSLLIARTHAETRAN